MGVIATALRAMLSAGMAADQIVDVISDMEAELAPKVDPRTERNRRYYQAKRLKASESRLKTSYTEAVLNSDESVLKRLNSDAERKPHIDSLSLFDSEELDKKEKQGRVRAKAADPKTPPKPAIRASRISENWTLGEAEILFGLKHGFSHQEIQRMGERFHNHWLAAKDGSKVNWLATWRTWVLNDLRWNPRQAPKTVGFV